MLVPFSFINTKAGYDPDAQAFFDRVTTAGGTLTTTEKNAVNQLVLDMKSAGIWTSMKAVYPMVGASAAACAQNLKSASFTGTFTSGWTFASTGVTGNGTSTYMNTGLKPSDLGQNSTHLSIYSRTDNSLLQCEMGTYTPSNVTYLIVKYGTAIYPMIQTTESTGGTSPYTTTLGLIIGNRNNSTQTKFYQNSSLIGTYSKTSTTPQSTYNIYLGASNENGTSVQHSTKQYAFASIGDGLTDTQASNFYTAVQTFNQTLNRQVGAQIVSDADAQAYINRVYTAGGTLTNTEANAVNQLVIDMKAAGIWTAMKAVYPMVGSSAAACAQNLKSSSFTGTFTSGWTFASTGVTGNGTSAYMKTGVIPSSNLSLDSTHLSYYSRTNSNGVEVEIGCGSNPYCLLEIRTSGLTYFLMNTNTIASTSDANSLGFYVGNRTASNVNNGFKNNTKIYNGTITSSSLSTNMITIGAMGLDSTGNSSTYPSTKQCAFASIGDGLTDTQASNFYTCVNTFQVSLSRNV